MKRISLLCFLVFLTVQSIAQVPKGMNRVKYIVVDPIYGDGKVLDPHGLVSLLSSSMIESGYTVLMNDKSNWPGELKKNPCLAAYSSIGLNPRTLGKYQVMFDFEDCDGVLIYRAKGGGSGNSESEAFRDAAVYALRKFNDFSVNFQEDKVKVSKDKDRLQFDEEELVSRLHATVNPMAGLYKVEEGEGNFVLAMLPEGEKWHVIVYESGGYSAEKGELLGVMESADISGIFNMNWKKFPGEKTLAKWDKIRLEISQPEGAGQASPLVLLRYIPED
ncbi:MAG: hypothetical protein WBB45_17620 [Cyclobacteriaceae bacterium]